MIPWTKITNLGDVTIMTVVVAVIAAGFIIERAWRPVVWWCLLFAAGMGLVVATKIAFLGWGLGIQALDFEGLSGHATRAFAVIPVLCYLIQQEKSAAARVSGLMLGVALGVAIAMSRSVLHFHSVSEIVAGSLLGLMTSACFIWMLGGMRQFALRRSLLAVVLIVVALTPYHTPIATPTQRWMVRLALYLSGRETPYGRLDHRSAHYAGADHVAQSAAWSGTPGPATPPELVRTFQPARLAGTPLAKHDR